MIEMLLAIALLAPTASPSRPAEPVHRHQGVGALAGPALPHHHASRRGRGTVRRRPVGRSRRPSDDPGKGDVARDGGAAPGSAAGDADIRPVHAGDLEFAADLHARALPHGFFPRLGRRYLAVYYESFFASPHGVAFIATAAADARPVGVLAGTLRNRAHYDWVAHHRHRRLAVAGLRALLVRPRTSADFVRTRARRYLSAFWRRRHADVGAGGVESEPDEVAVLTHVCVEAGTRGSGAGAALVDAFVAAARADDATEARLVTRHGPSGATGFYEKLGWRRIGARSVHEDQPLVEFRLALRERREG